MGLLPELNRVFEHNAAFAMKRNPSHHDPHVGTNGGYQTLVVCPDDGRIERRAVPRIHVVIGGDMVDMCGGVHL
jgi:hypothetical protein